MKLRAGSDNTFIELSKGDPSDFATRIAAKLEYSGICFSATHDRVVLETSSEARSQLKSFTSLETDFFSIRFTEDGEFNITRNSHGELLIQYRIGFCRSGSNASLNGEARVDAEFSQEYLRQLAFFIGDQ